MTFLKRLTATHKTELFLLALAAAFDLSQGLEKLLIWLGRPPSSGWLALLYITFGLIIAAVGVYNLVCDINTDCQEPSRSPLFRSVNTIDWKRERQEILKELRKGKP